MIGLGLSVSNVVLFGNRSMPPAPSGGSSPPQVVARKNQANFNSSDTYSGAKVGYTFCQRIVFARGCSDVRFLFTNPSDAGINPTNVLTLKVSLETVNGGNSTFYPLTVGGSRTITVATDALVWTDAFTQSFLKGDIIYLRTFVTSTTGEFPTGANLSSGFAGEGVLDGDYTNQVVGVSANSTVYSINGTSTITGTPTHENSFHQPGLSGTYASDSNGYAAALCVGTLASGAVALPVVAMIGDSISRGVGADGSFDFGIGYGFMQIAVNAADGAWIDLGANGESSTGFTGATRASFLDYCTHAMVEYGVNDISLSTASNARITEITTALQDIFSICKVHGVSKVYATTTVVRTNSTDNWATTTNQTAYNNGFVPRAGGGNNTWQDLTSWIKGNSVTPGSGGGAVIPAPTNLDGYFDTGPAVTMLKSGNIPVWKVGSVMLADALGVHPNQVGHEAMAAVIPASAFAV